MTEEGRNAVKEFMVIKKNEKNLNNNQIKLDNYFNYSGKTEEMNRLMKQQIDFHKKLKPKTLVFTYYNYEKRYIPNPKRTNPKRKLNK